MESSQKSKLEPLGQGGLGRPNFWRCCSCARTEEGWHSQQDKVLQCCGQWSATKSDTTPEGNGDPRRSRPPRAARLVERRGSG